MIKAIIIAASALTLSACQIQETLVETSSVISCKMQPDKLEHWIDLENQYQNATIWQKRNLLSQARKVEDKATLALLLSQPESSEAQLKQALALFAKMDLEPTEYCLADRYLHVRYKLSRGVLTLQQALNGTDQQRKALMRERDNLVKQIDALTDIERDISNQKEGEDK